MRLKHTGHKVRNVHIIDFFNFHFIYFVNIYRGKHKNVFTLSSKVVSPSFRFQSTEWPRSQ